MTEWKQGMRFRVIKPGASLCGFQPTAPYVQTGWSKNLVVGDVITCMGENMTQGDGVPALKWADADGQWLANDCLFRPVIGGMWGGQIPAPGYLEPIATGE